MDSYKYFITSVFRYAAGSGVDNKILECSFLGFAGEPVADYTRSVAGSMWDWDPFV
jgi:hypothetical protein